MDRNKQSVTIKHLLTTRKQFQTVKATATCGRTYQIISIMRGYIFDKINFLILFFRRFIIYRIIFTFKIFKNDKKKL